MGWSDVVYTKLKSFVVTLSDLIYQSFDCFAETSADTEQIIHTAIQVQNPSSGGGRHLGVTPQHKEWKSDWKLLFSRKNHSDTTRQAHGEVDCDDKAVQPHQAGGDDQHSREQQTEQ